VFSVPLVKLFKKLPIQLPGLPRGWYLGSWGCSARLCRCIGGTRRWNRCGSRAIEGPLIVGSRINQATFECQARAPFLLSLPCVAFCGGALKISGEGRTTSWRNTSNPRRLCYESCCRGLRRVGLHRAKATRGLRRVGLHRAKATRGLCYLINQKRERVPQRAPSPRYDVRP
jgi:hypothetical protein